MRAAKKAGHVGTDLPPSGRAGALDLRARQAGGPFVGVAFPWPAGHDDGADRPPSGCEVPIGAAGASTSTYLKREGVTRDGADARMFDARSDDADAKAFAERCEEDRHHFRFIVSPEDAAELEDLRTFTRELMKDVERDLGTRLDWVAVDHWNTDNPHIHVLIRGRADDGQDLVISREYISRGFRDRAAERVTLELGPRSEQEIRAALEKEVEAERWTSLDRALRDISDEGGGVVDFGRAAKSRPELRRLHARPCGKARAPWSG